MSLSLDEYRIKLINRILLADSQEEVKQFIDATVISLEQNKVNEHIITQFINKITSELSSFNPMLKNAQQWSNIRIAKIVFNRIKNQRSAATN
jgi:hypothetical protein